MDVPEVNRPFVARSASQWRCAAAYGRLGSEAEAADNARAHTLRYRASAAARARPRASRLDLAAAEFDLAPAPPPAMTGRLRRTAMVVAADNRGVRLEHFRQRRQSRLLAEPLEAPFDLSKTACIIAVAPAACSEFCIRKSNIKLGKVERCPG